MGPTRSRRAGIGEVAIYLGVSKESKLRRNSQNMRRVSTKLGDHDDTVMEVLGVNTMESDAHRRQA